jgi:ABC-type phosphate/phosphonate transport system substrate-binding protein
MYERPETRPAIDRLWKLIALQLEARNVPAPESLSRDRSLFDIWNDECLLLGQTCGWPYANLLSDKVIPVARFDYGVAGCKPGDYCSIYIGTFDTNADVVKGDNNLSQAFPVAINSADSQSGLHVFSQLSGRAAQDTIPDENRIVSGSHLNSLKMVAEGQARLAAIDAVTFELARRFDPVIVNKVRILGTSRPTPGLPLVTARKNNALVPALREAISLAIQAMSVEDSKTLMIHGLVAASPDDYSGFRQSF